VSAARPEAVVSVRAMTEADLPLVSDIEIAAYRYPWSGTIFRDCLRVGYCCRVVQEAGQVRGYAIMSVAVGEAHLLNLCIDVDARARGFGRRLLETVVQEAALLRARRMFLEVRPTNQAARRLYDSLGFRAVGRRKAYYKAPDGREDALVLSLDLEAAAAELSSVPSGSADGQARVPRSE
jgi:ribosomal-protein-alanine N-acetyltransferase